MNRTHGEYGLAKHVLAQQSDLSQTNNSEMYQVRQLQTESSEICIRCGLKNPDTECAIGEGWIKQLGQRKSDAYDDPVARCKNWTAKLASDKQSKILKAAKLDDSTYSANFEELELTETGWLAAYTISKKIVEAFHRGANMAMLGPPGCGKTHAAVLIARAALNAGMTAQKISWGRFFDFLMEREKRQDGVTETEIMDSLIAVDVLVIDDFGASQNMIAWRKAASIERIEKIILARYDQHPKMTIITSNYSQDELNEALGPRASSKIYGRTMWSKFDKSYRIATEQADIRDFLSEIWAEVNAIKKNNLGQNP